MVHVAGANVTHLLCDVCKDGLAPGWPPEAFNMNLWA
jgi:hypothetical protein